MTGKFSRRKFFGAAAGVPAAAAGPKCQKPEKAWVIVGVNWEYNDEYSYESGEFQPVDRVFFDLAEAEKELARVRAEFFDRFPTPEDFEPDFEAYMMDPENDNPTWADMFAAGFPEPFWLSELKT